MGIDVNCSGVRYAIIQASSNKDRPERLAIAYEHEGCLRDLIAAPSIIGLGFASREEAMVKLGGISSDAGPSKQKPLNHEARENRKFDASTARASIARIGDRIFQSAVAGLIALFYSKNLASVMIRIALGAFSSFVE
jgi:hypothetical protein